MNHHEQPINQEIKSPQALVDESRGLSSRLRRFSPTKGVRGPRSPPHNTSPCDVETQLASLKQESAEKDKRIERLTRQLTVLQQTATDGPNVREKGDERGRRNTWYSHEFTPPQQGPRARRATPLLFCLAKVL